MKVRARKAEATRKARGRRRASGYWNPGSERTAPAGVGLNVWSPEAGRGAAGDGAGAGSVAGAGAASSGDTGAALTPGAPPPASASPVPAGLAPGGALSPGDPALAASAAGVRVRVEEMCGAPAILRTSSWRPTAWRKRMNSQIPSVGDAAPEACRDFAGCVSRFSSSWVMSRP